MNLTEELMRFHLTEMEARIYVTLVQGGRMNGSQIARELSANRSSVYTALNHLTAKQVVLALPGDPTEYTAEDPEVLVQRYRREYQESLSYLKYELNNRKSHSSVDQYVNVRGRTQCIGKTRELLSSAQRELLIHSNLDLWEFQSELSAAQRRGVRLIVFSFVPVRLPELDGKIELYHSTKFDLQESEDKRIMAVADMSAALIAGGRDHDTYLGTQSGDPLFISIVAEHIHHDVYLYTLEQQAGRDLIDERVKLGSLLERQFDSWISHLPHPEVAAPRSIVTHNGEGEE